MSPIRLHVAIRRTARFAQGVYSLALFKPELAEAYSQRLAKAFERLRRTPDLRVVQVIGPFHAEVLKWCRSIAAEWHHSRGNPSRWELLRRLLPMPERMHERLAEEAAPKLSAVGIAKPAPELVSNAEPEPQPPVDHNHIAALLRVFTNGVTDERIRQAAEVLADNALTADEKLAKVDSLIRLPTTASASMIAKLLECSKTSIVKTSWWREHRRGLRTEAVEQRRLRLIERGRRYDGRAADGR